MRIISKADQKVREFFVDRCYSLAGVENILAEACDFYERDTLDLVWSGLNFVDILTVNSEKYMSEYGSMDQETFDGVMEYLTNFSTEFFELLDEVDNHKEITLLRLKTLIDDRTNLVVQSLHSEATSADPTIIQHTIEVETAQAA